MATFTFGAGNARKALRLPLYALGAWLSVARGIGWAPVPLALVATAIAYAGSVWWSRVFRREMLAGVA